MGYALPKFDYNAAKKLEEVSLSMDGTRLVLVFENGDGFSIPRRQLPHDDGSPITSIQIFNHRMALAIHHASGTVYDMPSDSLRHYAQGGKQKTHSIGSKLKKIREALGFSRSALAEKTGMSRMQIFRLETGKANPTLDTILSLSTALKTTPKELVN